MSQFNGFKERREREKPQHIHQSNLLKAQQGSAKKLTSEGYGLWFTRVMSKDNVLAVFKKAEDSTYLAVIYYDGEIDYDPKIKLRV